MPAAPITFEEDSSPYYKERTRRNAESADVTIAFAVDFSTAGEKCTKNVAGDRYIAINLPPLTYYKNPDNIFNRAMLKERVEKIEAGIIALSEKYGFQHVEVDINVAGNGVYTLKQHGISQNDVDRFVTDVFRSIETRPNIHIHSIRSGGQTGIDESGIKAATALGIPATVLAPKGWKFRGPDGVDISEEQAFKARFNTPAKKSESIENQPLFEPFEIENILIGKFFHDDTFHEKEIPIDFTRANGQRYTFVASDYILTNSDDNSADPIIVIGYYDESGKRVTVPARETEAKEMNAILFSMQDKYIQADLFRRMKDVRAERDDETTQRYRFNNLFKSNVLAFNSDVDVDGNLFSLPEGQYMGSVLKKTVEDALAEGFEKNQVKAFAAEHKEIIETRYYLIESQKKLAEEAIALVSGEEKQYQASQHGKIRVVNVRDFGGPDGFESASRSNVYIGRRPQGNVLGNPFTHIANKQTLAKYVVGSREESVEKYSEYFDENYGKNKEYTNAIDAIYERVKSGEDITLGCWCKPLACHGDIIKAKLEERLSKDNNMEQTPVQQHDTFQDKCRRAIASGKIKSVGELRDGWAKVETPGGKFNYANAEGKFMTKNWFDSATEFSHGTAVVTRDGNRITIDNGGIARSITPDNAPKIRK